MKVLLITQEFPPNVLGGVGYHAYNLANALTDRGHSVHVLTGESDGHVSDDSNPVIPGVSVSVIRYRRSVAPRLWFARKARHWLQSWDRLAEFDLVHAHEYVDFDGLSVDGVTIQKVHFNLTEKPRYTSLAGVPSPVESVAFALARSTIWKGEQRLERRAIRTADATIANSELTRGLCETRHSLGESDIHVVYNAVDTDRFTPGEGSTAGDYFLFVGGGQERKGFDGVIEAVRSLGPATDTPLKIAGSIDPDEVAELESTAPVEFLGHVSQADLVALYRNAVGLVHPALYEPFGNVVLESLACGTPVVVSDAAHCGVTELIDDETGIVVDPEESADVARAMTALATDRDRFSASRCRDLATRYTWDRVAERTIEIASRIHRGDGGPTTGRE